jgi:hypothetical protein
MSGISPVERAGDYDFRGAPPFLKTHRALAVCGREFACLADEIDARLTTLLQAGLDAKPELRHSPGRCIVQLGAVALTVAWVRNQVDSVEDGRLLAIVWHGAVASRRPHVFERRDNDTSRTATALWEDVMVANASTESDWSWCSEKRPAKCYSSSDLATRLVQRLHRAYAEYQRAG